MFYSELYSKRDVIDIQELKLQKFLIEKTHKPSETGRAKFEKATTPDERISVVTNSKRVKAQDRMGSLMSSLSGQKLVICFLILCIFI